MTLLYLISTQSLALLSLWLVLHWLRPWFARGELKAHRPRGEDRFHKAELDDWVRGRNRDKAEAKARRTEPERMTAEQHNAFPKGRRT